MKRLLISGLAALFIGGTAASAQTGKTIVTIDTGKRTPISRYIYGANFPDWDKIGLPFPLARQGGNRMTAYNWETNASNAGNDWHHQNDGYMSNSNEPGLIGRQFLESTRRHQAAAILTVPMAGYVAADKKGDGDVNQTPNYLEVRFKKSLPRKPGKRTYPPNAADNAVYQDEYVAYMEKVKGNIPVWYALDNEPDIWSGTHARIVPTTPTYASFIARSIEYAAAIKAVAPRSLILGPVSYGWQGFRRFQNASDANNRDFLDVYLSALQDASKKQGKRLLDLLDVHWYPEARGGGKRVTEESDNPATATARIQAPRSLWDATYIEDSWIVQATNQKPIALLPGLQKQIATHYPGTRLAITEYNYGGKNDISGAIAQADVLGIFGRYGVFAACNWGIGPGDTAEIAGFRAFLNFDGKGGRFGDLGLSVKGETPAEDSVYAALDSKNPRRMTIVVINKTKDARPVQMTVNGFVARSAAAYAVSSAALKAATPVVAKAAAGKITLTAPALSVTTVSVLR